MKIYVAGKFEKKDMVLDAYKKIEALGHKVSYNWTTHKFIKPYVENQDMSAKYSENEMQGIINCDIFIYLSDERGHTLLMEFGAAVILAKTQNKPIIYAVGKFNDQSPWFFNSVVKRYDSLEKVLEDIARY